MALLLLLALGVIDTFPQPAAAEVQPRRPEPPPPAETFSVPTEMSRAEAIQWSLSKRRSVQGVSPALYALSVDDRWLAAGTEDRLGLRLIDLHTFDAGKTISLPRPVDRLSFDPLGKQVIAASDESSPALLVIDAQRGTVITLPVPKKRAVPQGSLLWWKEHEVLIGTSERDLQVLNLDTLEADQASTVSSWKETRITEQERIIRELPSGLRNTPRWKWEVSHSVQGTELPEVEGTLEWQIGLSPCLAISHPEQDFSLAFPEVSFEEGDLLSSSGDGAKVFRTRGNTLDIFYFSLSPAPHLKWTLSMPHGIGKCSHAEEAKRALGVSRLCALVYAPLHNPLNGKVVGPDRAQPKAVLTFDAWDGDKAECHVSALYAPIGPKDVAADPCLWNGPATELLALDTPHRWWTGLPDPMPGSDAASALPTRASIDAKVALLEKAEADKAAAEESARRLLAPAAAAPPPSAALDRRGLDDLIRDFVVTHHQAARAGDIDRLLKDYADRVDYFKEGWVDREFILRDELKYHAENAVLEERVVGDIQVSKLFEADIRLVAYVLRVSIQNLATRQVKNFVFDVSLHVAETPDGLKILRQKAVKQP